MRPCGAVPGFVQVETRDGFPMEAMLIKPKDFDASKKSQSCVLFSGPHAPLRDRWNRRDFLWHNLLAQNGYVVFCCDNRSASGKGHKFAKACWRKLGQSELQDLSDGVDWLVARGYADPGRIAIWGWSYGGYQTLYNLTQQVGGGRRRQPGHRLAALRRDLHRALRRAAVEQRRRLREGSVTSAAKDLHGALLLIAGAMDDNVHMQNSFQFLHAMQRARTATSRVTRGCGTASATCSSRSACSRFLRFLGRSSSWSRRMEPAVALVQPRATRRRRSAAR